MVRVAMLLFAVVLLSACDRSASDGPTSRAEDSTTRVTATSPGATTADQPGAPPDAVLEISPEAIAWMRQRAIPFTTSRAESGFADLQPLREVIGDARIVSLGEATHGTHEFFAMKHRLLEFLVKEMGFTTFAIEASWAEANLINDYVHTGQGDPRTLLSGLGYWVWNTQEVLDLIVWMRRHNENPGGAPAVSFSAFDMQSPRMAMQHVIDYLTPLDPQAAARASSRYACLQQYASGLHAYAAADGAVRTTCRDVVQAQYEEVASLQAVLEPRTSRAAYARARQGARVATQSEAYWGVSLTNPGLGIRDRDRAMADNAAWILEQAGPDAKMVLWAHNGHVQNSPGSMGAHLRERFGAEMVIVGFDFYRGSFHAVPFHSGQPSGPIRFHQESGVRRPRPRRH